MINPFRNFLVYSLLLCSVLSVADEMSKGMKLKENLDVIRKESEKNKSLKNEPLPANDPQWAFVPQIVATVGEKNITKNEFLLEIQKLLPKDMPKIPSDELPVMARKAVEKMVNRIIFDRLVRSDDIIPSSDLVKKEFDSMLNSFSKDQVENMVLQLKEQGMSLESYVNALSQDDNIQLGIAINKWIEKNIASKVTIDDKEIEKYYRDHQGEFRVPASVKLYHILIRVKTDANESQVHDYAEGLKDDPKIDIDQSNKKEEEKIKKIADAEKDAVEKIDAIRMRLIQGEDFGRIAENESDCPISRSKRGDLGYLPVNENKMLPEFEKAVAKLKVNEISKPVKTKYGYHILKITDKKGESYKTLESVKESIREELRNKRMYEILQKYMEKEKNALKVKINI